MKKLHILWTVLVTVALAACATVEKEEEPGANVPEGFKVLTIQAGRADGTKTSYANEVTFSWSAGDQISVLCNDGTNNFWQTFTADSPSKSSTFTATVGNSTQIGAMDGTKAALYPADDDHVYTSASAISFHIPAERDFRSSNGGHKETAIPMFAWGDDSNSFAFANLTGAVKFTFINIPSTTSHVKFVFKNTGGAKLNGSYDLGLQANTAASDVSWPVVTTSTDTEKIATCFADAENGTASFYLPFGTGTIWPSDHLWLYDADTDAILFPKSSEYSDGHFKVSGRIDVTKNRIVVLPSLDAAIGAVEVPGKASAYGIDWSTIEAANNTNSTYPAIKAMKATADDDYLYLYLEVDPSQLEKTHSFDHQFAVYAAGAGGSNGYWSNASKINQIGDKAWAVEGGNIAFQNWDDSYCSSDLLAQTNTWYYELRYSRTATATSSILAPAGTLNIGVVMDDNWCDSDGNGETWKDGTVNAIGIIPAAGGVMYPVTLPGSSSGFTYTSAYNLDWSNVDVAENTNVTDYPVLKSMRAQGDDDYLYLLLEMDPAQMETNHTYSHRINLYAGNWSTGFGAQSWAIHNSNAAYYNWESGYSDCTPDTSGNSSWYYEIRISRTHSTTSDALSAAGTVNIGVKLDNRCNDNDTYGYTHNGSSTTTIGKIPSSDLYPVTFANGTTAPVNNVNINEAFTESDAVIANPERGWYKMVEYKYHKRDDNEDPTSEYTSATSGVNDSNYQCYQDSDHTNTLVLTLFYMMDYVNADHINSDGINYVRNVLSNIRSKGKKAIVRFAYNPEHPSKHDQEPTLARIQNHLADLTQTFTDFEDIIYVVQAGFMGTYGEWYYTTNFGPSKGGVDYTINKSGGKYSVSGFENSRGAVITALLNAVPSSRQIEFRTPEYKACYTNPTNLANYEQLTGFGTDAAHRLAFHNDAFLYGGSNHEDMGTFHYDWSRTMWSQQGAYLINGGEAPYSSSPVSGMDGYTYDNVKAGVYNYHYSYLHHDSGFHSSASDGSTLMLHWHQQGWMRDIEKWLGYRLYLTDAAITGANLNSGTTLNVNLTLKNSGAAPVVNIRPMKLVLLHNGTPVVLKNDVGDVRLVPCATLSGTTVTPGSKTYQFTVTLPQNITSGDQLALWLPDQDPNGHGLQERAAYSIRLANNETTWTSGGYNVFYTF